MILFCIIISDLLYILNIKNYSLNVYLDEIEFKSPFSGSREEGTMEERRIVKQIYFFEAVEVSRGRCYYYYYHLLKASGGMTHHV